MLENEFNTKDPNYPSNLLDDEGRVQESQKKLLKTLPKIQAVGLTLGWCLKARTNEYSSIQRVTREKVYLKGLKGSESIRDLAKIEPFYTFLMQNRDLLKETIEKELYSEDKTYRFFKSLGGPPRMFERATITFLAFSKKTNGVKVAGHKNSHNTKIYQRTPEYSVKAVKEKLKGNPDLLILFNGLLSAFNRTIDRLETRIEKLEG